MISRQLLYRSDEAVVRWNGGRGWVECGLRLCSTCESRKEAIIATATDSTTGRWHY